MIRKKPSARENSSSTTTTAGEEETEWEMRPGGMLVQKRTVQTDAPARNLRLRIAYGALRYEICVSSMATFGKTSSGSKLPLLILFCSAQSMRKIPLRRVMLLKLSQVAVSMQNYESIGGADATCPRIMALSASFFAQFSLKILIKIQNEEFSLCVLSNFYVGNKQNTMLI